MQTPSANVLLIAVLALFVAGFVLVPTQPGGHEASSRWL